MDELDEFIVIVEGSSDGPIVTELAERIFFEKGADWLEDYLPVKFVWSGLKPNKRAGWSYWKNFEKDVKDLGVRPVMLRGQKVDQKIARKMLHVVSELQKYRSIRAVLLIWDIDNKPKRRLGLEKAREIHMKTFPELEIVIGMAEPMREAWVLNGFVAKDGREAKILQEHKEKLKFDPCLESERLRSRSSEMPNRIRNIKIVTEALTGGDKDREAMCWQETDLDVLRERGRKTGLTAYMEEVELRLLPILEK